MDPAPIELRAGALRCALRPDLGGCIAGLWQRELPVSMRERGPKVVRERVKIAFEGGGMRLHRDVHDGDWCDVWLFDDLVLPTGMLHACGGLPVDQHTNRPAIYEEFRPGTHDQAARLADMDEGHVEVSITYPNTFPRFAGQGFASGPTTTSASPASGSTTTG